MATIFVAQSPPMKVEAQNIGVAKEEIEGLIKVYKDGHVERPEIVQCVTPALPAELGVVSKDIVINKSFNIWARFYAPTAHRELLPLLVYFHGGGFCVGSAAWSCYHEFLAKLAAKSSCLIMSVNYRLAPENPLPAAYEDGLTALLWLKRTALIASRTCNRHGQWWTRSCDFERVFLAGDSAGANIAHYLSKTTASLTLRPLGVRGVVLLQPFFGGEKRTASEKLMAQPPRSALSLAASDAYWRMALPAGADRDHPWCNPLMDKEVIKYNDGGAAMLVCVSEMDILRDRNVEFCSEMRKRGNCEVELEMYRGVGHAFQVLSKSHISQTRSLEMLARIHDFITRC